MSNKLNPEMPLRRSVGLIVTKLFVEVIGRQLVSPLVEERKMLCIHTLKVLKVSKGAKIRN